MYNTNAHISFLIRCLIAAIDHFCEQSYEARIDALQRQVEEQSMTMSMYSSYTPEDFNNIEEDIFGEYEKHTASESQYILV